MSAFVAVWFYAGLKARRPRRRTSPRHRPGVWCCRGSCHGGGTVCCAPPTRGRGMIANKMKRSPQGGRLRLRPPMGDRHGWLAVAAAFAVPAATMFALKMLTAGASEQSSAWLRGPTAVAAGWAVRAVGVPVVIANGTELVLRNHILRIDLACTASTGSSSSSWRLPSSPSRQARSEQPCSLGCRRSSSLIS